MSIHLAAVGDSLTKGARCNPDGNPWPTLLDRSGLYTVRNFGATEGKAVHFIETPAFREIGRWNPSVVLVMLGTSARADTC